MIIINTVDTQRFSLNGIEYFKNFTPVVAGDTIRVHNTYNDLTLTTATNYADFTVDGNTFLTVGALQSALLPVIYTRDTLGVTIPENLNIQTEITANETFNGTKKGITNLYPINSESDLEMTFDKGTYAVGDVVNLKRRGFGGLEIKRGTDVRLEGKRDINNEFKIANKGNLASVVFDRLDGSTLVGSVIGDITGGYSGVVTTSSYTELKEGDTNTDITVIGTGFSSNMIVSVSANATQSTPFTYINNNEITLHLTAVGLENDTVTVTYDNGDVFVDTDAITIQAVTPSNIVMQDDFNDNSIDFAKWTITGAFGKITEANQRLEFDLDHADAIIGNNLDHTIKANTTFNSDKIWIQTDLEIPNTQADGGIIHFGLFKTSDGNNNNCIRLIGDTTNIGRFKFQVFSGGVKEYEVSNIGGTTGTYKIGYDITTNDIQFFELTAPDTWVQIGTTQNYDIIGDELTETLTALYAITDALAATEHDYTYADNFYISTADYSTSNPI